MAVAIEQWNVYVIMDGKEHYAKSQFVTSIVLGLLALAEYEQISIYLMSLSIFILTRVAYLCKFW